MLSKEEFRRFSFQIPHENLPPIFEVERDEHAHVPLTEEEIHERVYGQDRDIYVGRYRNQKLIDLEKENMDGDLSDLERNSMICVAAPPDCPDKRLFWIAKVEKLFLTSENGVPILVSVLWYACEVSDGP